ncbi:hypothetical protein ACX93W_01180 [Paenibacillus sp. CAU 1782]
MKIIEFLMSNIYVVLIGLFLLSRLFAKPKGKGNKPGGMPDFGGGGLGGPMHDDGHGRPSPDQQPASRQEGAPQRPWPGSVVPEQVDAGWPERQSQPASAGLPKQQVVRTGMQTVNRPERELTDRGTEAARAGERGGLQPKRSGSQLPGDISGPQRSKRTVSRASALLSGKPSAEDMRKAVLWAEVLGPPRSKRRLRQ